MTMTMTTKPANEEIADACRRLARLLDESKDNSGPWMMIPDAAKHLHKLLDEKLRSNYERETDERGKGGYDVQARLARHCSRERRGCEESGD